jgi:hypothetical protein
VDKFLTKMYQANFEFGFTVTRDFTCNCQTPVLILPDNIPTQGRQASVLPPCC